MPDKKDQFAFNDDEDFSPDSLGGRGTPSAEEAYPDLSQNDFQAYFPGDDRSVAGPEETVSVITGKDRGGPSTRLLLWILALVVVGAAGAYFFMDLGESPGVPAVQAPPMTASQSVPLPAQAAPPETETGGKNAAATDPPPPALAEGGGQPAGGPTNQPGKQTLSQTQPTAESAESVAPAPPVVASADANRAETQKPEAVAVAYMLDAGSYLLEANRKALVAKIRQLGYEPIVTPLDATLNMTRVRLGTFSREEVQEALSLARSIEPSSYSTPAGDGYVIYAGTFLKRDNVDKLSQRFAKEGIKVHAEPVQVVRTLSRIRFGQFATREDALAKASELDAAGVQAQVVRAK